QVLSILANLYSRQYSVVSLGNWLTIADNNEILVVENQDLSSGFHGTSGVTVNYTWDYTYIRELNLFIERIEPSSISEDLKKTYTAEARFLRAAYYFEMAQLFGGVPLILEAQSYDFSGDPTYLQVPRSTEAAVYDFVIEEAEALKELLPADASTKARATKGAALAMKARAAIYEASLARYGPKTP